MNELRKQVLVNSVVHSSQNVKSKGPHPGVVGTSSSTLSIAKRCWGRGRDCF